MIMIIMISSDESKNFLKFTLEPAKFAKVNRIAPKVTTWTLNFTTVLKRMGADTSFYLKI